MSDNGAEPPNPRKTSVPAGRSGLPDTELPTLSQTIGAGGGPPDKADEEFSPNLPVPGRMWGKYLIEKSLGRGGQAEVYQAFDRSGLAGHVALKVPREPVPTSSVETWSAAECGPLVQLDHPHIVRALDAGCIHGVPYVATQLVQGLPLDAPAKSRPPSDGQILEWMVQLADALVCAHGRGIVHRDIKPRNVIVTSEGRPLLLDFGIATLLSAYQSDHGAGVSGTPTFMPPEQARGDPGADHRVDVFALGGVLKYLLEGVCP